MKKPKMLKYPRKPRATASSATLENYLVRIKEIDKKNAHAKSAYLSDKKKKETLKKKVASVGKAKRF